MAKCYFTRPGTMGDFPAALWGHPEGSFICSMRHYTRGREKLGTTVCETMWLPKHFGKIGNPSFFFLPHVLYTFINMYKSPWDIDIEQGFLPVWDSRAQSVMPGNWTWRTSHRSYAPQVAMGQPGEHWYPYRVYKNRWQMDVEVLIYPVYPHFLAEFVLLFLWFNVRSKVDLEWFGHVWTYLDLISEKIWNIWKTQQESYNLGMFHHPFTFHFMGDVGDVLRLHLTTNCFARRRLCERCQGTTGTTVKDGSCRKSTRICVIYIDLCMLICWSISIFKNQEWNESGKW